MSFAKKFLIIISILLPAHPAWAATLAVSDTASQASQPTKSTESFYRKKVIGTLVRMKRSGGQKITAVRNALGRTNFIETPIELLAQAAYDEGPVERLIESDFIGRTETHELLLKEVSEFLGGNTITSLGTRALGSMITTFDKRNMQQVQTAVRRLAQDDALYAQVEQGLSQFAKNERAFLTYWDPKQHVKGPQPHLFAKAQELNFEELYRFEKYLTFGAPPLNELGIPNPAYLVTMIGNKFPIPTTPNAKQAGASVRVYGKLFHWVYSIIIAKNMMTVARNFATQGKFTNPLSNAGLEMKAILAATFLFWQLTEQSNELKQAHADYALKNTAYQAKKGTNDDAEKLERNKSEALLDKKYVDILEKGSFADAFMKTYEGHHPPPTDVDRLTQWTQSKIAWLLPSIIKNAPSAVFNKLPSCVQKPLNGVGMVIDDLPWIFASLFFIGSRTKQGIEAFGNSLLGFEIMRYTWDRVQDHATNLAESLRAVHSLHGVLCHDGELKKSSACAMLDDSVSASFSEPVREVMALAHDKAFMDKESRAGHALKLHDLMLRAAPELQTVVHGIAYLDALFALAKSVRSKHGCFVEWLPDEDTQAQMQIEDGIFVALSKATPNSVSLGVNCANKAIVTGPNGAGKSIFIKMVGSNVVLAHAFGIAFASNMRMHWLSLLRTSIDAGESVADELSRMQAQKMRMDSVMNELIGLTEKDRTAKGMFLTDEPLSGTTHTIAARKLQVYCDRIGTIPQMCGVMATHNEEPTKFVDKGFVNYQVCIEELPNGMFKPLFKVAPGIPGWWFSTDPETVRKQDLFVDYTVAIKHKTNIEKEIRIIEGKEREAQQLIASGIITDFKQKRHLKDITAHMQARLDYLRQEHARTIETISRLESAKEL